MFGEHPAHSLEDFLLGNQGDPRDSGAQDLEGLGPDAAFDPSGGRVRGGQPGDRLAPLEREGESR